MPIVRVVTLTAAFLLTCGTIYAAETLLAIPAASFPDYAPETRVTAFGAVDAADPGMSQTAWYWPFGGGSDSGTPKLKSTRKAFFLSFLLPGLGETYVGSKSGILFMGVEAASWWLYSSNTNKGRDLEDKFQLFADTHWHYADTVNSSGDPLDHNYWEWVQAVMTYPGMTGTLTYDPATLTPDDYDKINKNLEDATKRTGSITFGYSVHNLPSTNTQQYYEMIGKYPQFIYGWEDIANTELNLNPTIRNSDGSIRYEEDIDYINSNLADQYETMRDNSNKKLKAGQRGIHVMIINRVVSAVHAARMAHNHNERVNSALSEKEPVQIYFAEKYIIDNRVPMMYLTKRF